MVPLGFIIVTLVAGICLGYLFGARQAILRAIRKVPLTKVCDAKEGVVRVAGRLGYVGEPLVAPLTLRRCAYYEVLVEQLVPDGGSVTVIHETRGQDFLLRDGSGKAYVHLDSGLIVVVLDAHRTSGTSHDAGPELEAILGRHGESSKGLFFNRSLTYREGVLEEGELVTAMGVAVWEADPDPDPDGQSGGYREAPRRLALRSSARTRLRATDEPFATT